jgi:hypothetical protein
VVTQHAMIRQLAVLETVGPLDHLIHIDVAQDQSFGGCLNLRAGASLTSWSAGDRWTNRGNLERLAELGTGLSGNGWIN